MAVANGRSDSSPLFFSKAGCCFPSFLSQPPQSQVFLSLAPSRKCNGTPAAASPSLLSNWFAQVTTKASQTSPEWTNKTRSERLSMSGRKSRFNPLTYLIFAPPRFPFLRIPSRFKAAGKVQHKINTHSITLCPLCIPRVYIHQHCTNAPVH